VRQHLARAGHYKIARGRDRAAPRDERPDPEVLLEMSHAARNRLVGRAYGLRGPSQRPPVGQGHERNEPGRIWVAAKRDAVEANVARARRARTLVA
jgi:hypothetical protein